MKINYYALLIAFALSAGNVNAQSGIGSDTVTNFSKFKRSFTINGLLQIQYKASLTKNVNSEGVNFDRNNPVDGVSRSTNNFLIRRARINAKAQINDRFDANLLMNLAEFNDLPTHKVLENAFIAYHASPQLNIRAGQFQPFFGPEDIWPADVIKSIDFSNQYALYGKSGWQGFQLGLTAYGTLNPGSEHPINYYAGIYNGNNRNEKTDNDNSKNYYGRMEVNILKGLKIAANGAHGSWEGVNGHTFGGDFQGDFKLGRKTSLELIGEYKEGTNFFEYFKVKDPAARQSIGQYYNKGFFFFPSFRYDINTPRLRSIEFSSRYEYLKENYKVNDNLRQTITPMVSFEFSDLYYARLEFAAVIDLYDHNVQNTSQFSHTTGVVQLQIRF